MATSPTLIVAYVDDEGRYAYVADAAAQMASTSTARLIFYAPGAGAGRAGEKLGTTHPGYFELEDLSEAGFGQLATDVRRAREAGVEAFAWVPDGDDATELAEYAARQGADLVMLPAEKRRGGFLSSLFSRSLEADLEKQGRDVALVNEDGSIEYPQHEEAHDEGAESTRAAARDARLD